ncbi:LacI family DNA-binding transcriptional regulator [Labrys wisconsinensis]|uniref:LacI family transcriptional regulator n=1 Tax=Labrys wisconsinensis TaxID=425677 RepID=A0ABU0JD44_9HYPH|nr:LacI family DNA-binding transcriptional regulator [Labrys wisconsinensis]MDQ0472205.1 LacI family transcriptional regulator [Labrys wisconsinensis]
MEKRVARLSDVARSASVSVATVSRYLNNSIQLPEATAARVRQAIEALGYQPNPHARSLSRGRSDTLGLVVPDITNPYFARLAAAVEREAARRGYGLTLCASLNTQDREREYLARLSRTAVDGIIFVTNHPDDGTLKEPINTSSRRIVILDEDVAGVRGSKVFSDNEQGGFLAGRHLVEMGHRRIAFFGGPEAMRSTQARLAGVRRAIAEAGAAAEVSDVYCGDYSPEHGRACAERLLARSAATALLVSSDQIMIGALEIFRRERLPIPQRLSVIGFDDIAPFVLFDPPLTSIRQPVDAMGRRAVDLLVRALEGEAVDTVVEHLPVELILRESVARPPQDATTRKEPRQAKQKGTPPP